MLLPITPGVPALLIYNISDNLQLRKLLIFFLLILLLSRCLVCLSFEYFLCNSLINGNF